MNDLSPDSVRNAARDALYVSVGLGVIALQRTQVRRRALIKTAGNSGLDKLVGANLKMVDERLQDAEERIDAVLDEVETMLPGPAREVMSGARSVARDARDTVRKLF